MSNDDRIGQAVAHEYVQLPEESLLGILKNWLEVAATQLLINPSLYWVPAGLPFLKLGETKFCTHFPITRMDSIRAGLLGRWKLRLARSTASRVAHAEGVLRSLGSGSVQVIRPSGRGRSVYLRLPVLMSSKQKKDAVCRVSAEQGLGVSSMYPSSVQQIGELCGTLSSQSVPQSTMIAERLITLPTHELLSDADLVRICTAVQGVEQANGAEMSCSPEIREGQRRASDLPRVN